MDSETLSAQSGRLNAQAPPAFRLRQQVPMICAGAIMVAYMAPYVFLGQDFHASVLDALDSIWVFHTILLSSGQLLAPNGTIVPQMMGGLPRVSFPSEFDVVLWLFGLFGPWAGYVINRAIMVAVGFAGMYLLLRDHVVEDRSARILTIGVALCFGLLPYWPFGGLSIAGLPLVVWALLSLRKGRHGRRYWAVLGLWPLYSSFVLVGAFFLASMALLAARDLLRRQLRRRFILGLTVLLLAFIATNYRLVAFAVDGDFVSHRVENGGGVPARAALAEAMSLVSNGHIHGQDLHRTLVLPMTLIGLVLCAFLPGVTRRRYLWAVAFIGSTALFYGLLRWDDFQPLYRAYFRVLPVQLQRFYLLHPLLWYVLFAMALQLARVRLGRPGAAAAYGILALQLLLAGRHHEDRVNRNGPTVREFLAVNQFEQIAEHIGRPRSEFRVASMALLPSISQYNGFYTVDGYAVNYPLEYKHAFRRVIEGELAKSDRLRKYFDEFGSRAQLFSTELGRSDTEYRAGNEFEIRDLDIDLGALRELGGEYILSAVRIRTDDLPGLRFDRVFRDPTSAWDVYLYSVLPVPPK